jgi:hypothetical protein
MKNIQEYENYAIAAASKPNKLNYIKKKLFLQKNNNIFNAKIYTNNLEKGYKTVHQMFLKKIPPSHIYI